MGELSREPGRVLAWNDEWLLTAGDGCVVLCSWKSGCEIWKWEVREEAGKAS